MYTELSRVSERWKTTNLDTIRSFQDKDPNGNIIQRYSKLTRKEILNQKCRHYLPGTELLLSDDKDRKVYSFPTNRGVGMIAELYIENKKLEGVIYFGIGKDGVIYHKYFEPFEEQHNKSSLFADSTLLEETEEKEAWHSPTDVAFDVSDKVVISFKYGKTHSVYIHPVRRDLLDPNMFILN
jgi:hypothetical protein